VQVHHAVGGRAQQRIGQAGAVDRHDHQGGRIVLAPRSSLCIC
jgi:hypothetical protein